jgi:hypothetical protein
MSDNRVFDIQLPGFALISKAVLHNQSAYDYSALREWLEDGKHYEAREYEADLASDAKLIMTEVVELQSDITGRTRTNFRHVGREFLYEDGNGRRLPLSQDEIRDRKICLSGHSEDEYISPKDYGRWNEGYRIILSGGAVSPTKEIVLGYDPKQPQPYVTWVAVRDETGKCAYGHGNYFCDKQKALDALGMRVCEYSRDAWAAVFATNALNKDEQEMER